MACDVVFHRLADDFFYLLLCDLVFDEGKLGENLPHHIATHHHFPKLFDGDFLDGIENLAERRGAVYLGSLLSHHLLASLAEPSCVYIIAPSSSQVTR